MAKKTSIAPAAAYVALLNDVKARIRAAQIKAVLSVNRELIALYWNIGRAIVERQQSEKWGKSVVERLAADLRKEFPETEGFSAQNIWYMRGFYSAWSGQALILQQPVGELPGTKLQQQAEGRRPSKLQQAVGVLTHSRRLAQRVRKSGSEPILRQPIAELPPEPLARIPWGHNIALIEKLKDPATRLWYAQQTVAKGWSRSMLLEWMNSKLHMRQGNAVTNFKSSLPAPQSDLAQQLIKDPYNFGFLTLASGAAERELELGLVSEITRFLIELGAGFAYVGKQVPITVDGKDFFLDLLFYHLHLRCFFVIDLKVGEFQPEFAGKMNFYLSAVDDQMRAPHDGPSLGLILCRIRSKVIAEYALRHLTRPVGVARYETRLAEKLPSKLAGQLPSIRQIEQNLSLAHETSRKPDQVANSLNKSRRRS